MRTIALHVLRLEAGASVHVEASTLSCVYAVMQGTGDARFADEAFAWQRGDVVAAPSGCAYTFAAREHAYLLRVSDEPLMKFLDWLRPIPVNG